MGNCIGNATGPFSEMMLAFLKKSPGPFWGNDLGFFGDVQFGLDTAVPAQSHDDSDAVHSVTARFPECAA